MIEKKEIYRHTGRQKGGMERRRETKGGESREEKGRKREEGGLAGRDREREGKKDKERLEREANRPGRTE